VSSAQGAVNIVVARAGSTGVRGKNLKKVGGLPLIVRAFRHAHCIDSRIPPVLSTNSQEAVDSVASDLGISAPLLSEQDPSTLVFFDSVVLHRRPEELATASAPVSRVLQVLRESFLEVGFGFARWNLVQPTAPFRSYLDITKFNEVQQEIDGERSFVSVSSVAETHPARMYVRANDNCLENLGVFRGLETVNRQELPEVFIRDGAFYSIGDSLVSQGIQVGNLPRFFQREYPWTINIDDEKSLKLARNESRKLEAADAAFPR